MTLIHMPGCNGPGRHRPKLVHNIPNEVHRLAASQDKSSKLSKFLSHLHGSYSELVKNGKVLLIVVPHGSIKTPSITLKAQ